MPENKKILLADPDKKITSALKEALKASGFDMIISHDGATALQKALSEAPAMIILSLALPTIDGIKLSQILHSNPRMESVPFIFLSDYEIQISHFQSHKDALFIKPVNVDEVVARVQSYFYRVDRTREVSREGRMIEGSLSDISLPDLLQMFSMNKKDGKLCLVNNKDKGDIYIRDGSIVDAILEDISGEKALFRLLTWGNGSFKFLPARVTVHQKINRPADNLIMEGLRQYDEWESLKDKFPPMDARLKVLVDPAALPKGLRPVTQEILFHLEFYPRLSDIIDRNTFPDYEVMRTIMTLLNKGIIGITKEMEQPEKPLLPKDDILKLRDRLAAKNKSKLDMELLKVLIFSSDNERAKYIINALNTLPEFHVHQDFLRGIGPNPYLGAAGSLQVSDSIQLNFIIVPLSDRFSPLWRPLSSSMLCGLSIISEEKESWADLKSISQYFHGKLAKPMVFINPDEEPSKERVENLRKYLDWGKEILPYTVQKKDTGGVRSMLNNMLHSVIGDL